MVIKRCSVDFSHEEERNAKLKGDNGTWSAIPDELLRFSVKSPGRIVFEGRYRAESQRDAKGVNERIVHAWFFHECSPLPGERLEFVYQRINLHLLKSTGHAQREASRGRWIIVFDRSANNNFRYVRKVNPFFCIVIACISVWSYIQDPKFYQFCRKFLLALIYQIRRHKLTLQNSITT